MPTDPGQPVTTVKNQKPGHYNNQCHLLIKQREQFQITQNNPGNKNSGANNSNTNSNVNNNKNNNNKNSHGAERKRKTVYPPCETCGKNKALQRQMLFWSQCSQSSAFPAHTTARTEAGPRENQSI